MVFSDVGDARVTRNAGNATNREFQLIRAIVRGQTETVEALCKAPEFDWHAFLQYAENQRVAACVYLEAKNRLLLPLLHQPTVALLRKSFLTQWRWNLLLLGQIAELDGKLGQSGREVIVLKGLHLAEEYFGQLAARQVGDIDLLMPDRHDLYAFEKILGDLGYLRRSRILGSRALMTRYTHHMEFGGPLAPLDLHWVLRQHPSFALDYEDIWRRKQRVRVRNIEFLALDTEYELVLQLLSIHTDIQVGILRLKPFVDLYAILSRLARTLAWEAFFLRRAEDRLLRISINVLDLALDILDCRGEFEILAESLRYYRGLIVLADSDSKLDLFRGTGDAMTWALRLYDTSRPRAFVWWGLALPFRLAESSRWIRRRTEPRRARETPTLARSA
jgi:hypothetical protein